MKCVNCNKNDIPEYRKIFCDVCAANKKAQWDAKQQPEVKPQFQTLLSDAKTASGDEKWETETMINDMTAKPKDNGFHLTPEQCRSNALTEAINVEPTRNIDAILTMAKVFEKYIVTGE